VTRRERVLVASKRALIVAVCVALAYLSVVALFSWVPPIWFGQPGSGATIAIVAVALTVVCVINYRAQIRDRPGAIPTGVIVILVASSAALAFSSFFHCYDHKHPPLVTALIWTIGAIRGSRSGNSLADGHICPAVTPAALDIARTAGQFVLYVGVIAIVAALVTTEIDRARIKLARSVTAIVDIDDDSRSMVTAVALTVKREKQGQLALIVAQSQVTEVSDLRGEGARIIVADLDKLDRLELLPLWKKIHQLYLLSASPATNLRRLAAIEQRMRPTTRKHRLPLILRVDDPWQAQSWRSQRLGGSDTLWAAEVVGIYEVTADRLLDRIIGVGRITRIAVCGSSPLTLALCASLARRRLEHSYYTPPDAPPLPALTIVANNAEEYRKDIDIHHRQLGFPPADQWLAAVDEVPSLASLITLIKAESGAADAEQDGQIDAQKDGQAVAEHDGHAEAENAGPAGAESHGRTLRTMAMRVLRRTATPAGRSMPTQAQMKTPTAVKEGDAAAGRDGHPDTEKNGRAANRDEDTELDIDNPSVAVVFALPPGQGSADAMLGTRLAARFPGMPIFALDPKTDQYEDTMVPIVGQLSTFRPAMDVPYGQGHDAWERAAMLIHERYAAQAGHHSDVTKPWAELDEFYRGSNRRLVRNTLWMVEKIAGRTWDTFGGVPDQPVPADLAEAPPLERLAAIGFDRDTAMDMAEAEHEDWVRYLRRWGWRYAPTRDNARKERPDLVPWHTLVKENPDAVGPALNSLATTLYSLRELGFRSQPVWQRYRRIGTVTARRHLKPWTWTTASGEAMRARAGDWEVSDGEGGSWSVRDKIFRSTYVQIDGNRWRRTGCLRARPAHEGETIETLEGQSVAAGTDWVVEGTEGEQWVVPPDVFARQYEPLNAP